MRPPPGDSGRPRFPDVDDEIGEDPARWLAYSSAYALARIRGIDRVDVARAWIDVELALADERGDDGPRSALLGALNARIIELQEHGERDEKLQQRREIDPSRRTPPTFVDVDGQEYPADEWRQGSASAKIARLGKDISDVPRGSSGTDMSVKAGADDVEAATDGGVNSGDGGNSP